MANEHPPELSDRVEEPEIPDEDRAKAADAFEEAGCSIERGYPRGICGRKLHKAPDGVDSQPVCLMHSNDPGKRSGPLFKEFWRIFEQILEEAGEGLAEFDQFSFPELDLAGRTFKAYCRFERATFTQNADFSHATFTQKADFTLATFTQKAIFKTASFWQHAVFCEASFLQDADFDGSTFSWNANFLRASFMQGANFANSTFTQKTEFSQTIFWEDARFLQATFTQDAGFHGTKFTQNAGFHLATFQQRAGFTGATFTQTAQFVDTVFRGTADWQSSRFLDSAEFRHVKFEPATAGEPSAVFSLAQFAKPHEVVFDDVNLSRVLFHNCDVTEFWFTSSVRWTLRPGKFAQTIFEETIPLDQRDARGIIVNSRRDFLAISQIYRQLKKNYDARLDYPMANSLHYGEMEMRRRAESAEMRDRGLTWFSHPRLNLLALYGVASQYGNSYRQAMLWLLAFLAFFALSFPIPGLESGKLSTKPVETYVGVWYKQDSWTNNLWSEAKLTGKSAIAAVDTATFQRNAEYTPAYPWGRVLAILETLITSTLFALFLLAIRRQFKR